MELGPGFAQRLLGSPHRSRALGRRRRRRRREARQLGLFLGEPGSRARPRDWPGPNAGAPAWLRRRPLPLAPSPASPPLAPVGPAEGEGGRVRLRGQPAEPPPPAPQAHPPVPVRRLGGRTLPAVRRGCPQNRARPPLASGNPMRGPRGRRSAGVVAPALRRLRRLRPWRAPGAGVGAARLPTARRRRAGPPRPPWSRPGQVPPVLSSAGAP